MFISRRNRSTIAQPSGESLPCRLARPDLSASGSALIERLHLLDVRPPACKTSLTHHLRAVLLDGFQILVYAIQHGNQRGMIFGGHARAERVHAPSGIAFVKLAGCRVVVRRWTDHVH